MSHNGQPSMTRWLLATAAVFFVVYVGAVLITGEPTYLLAGILVVVLVGIIFGVNYAAKKRIEKTHHGSLEEAMSDETEGIPAAHLLAEDDGTAVGDTDEVHDEISPHDLPKHHPGRAAAEAMVADEADGTTKGHEDGGADGADGTESNAAIRGGAG